MQPELTGIELYEPEGHRLLAIGHQSDGEPSAFTCRAGNGTLLSYYFGKGLRDVVVHGGSDEDVTAHLGTRWDRGHRRWTLDW